MKKFKFVRCAVFYLAACIAASGVVRTQQDKALDDQGITAAVNVELLYDDNVTANDVDVDTKDGIVILTGTAQSIGVKERVQSLASAVRGVQSVVNRIEVKPTVSYSDKKLTKKVNTALVNDPATDAFELNVSVEEGVVTLTGEVESFAEKQLSGSVAKRVAGVVDLENNIEVNYATLRSDSEIKADVLACLKNDIRVDANLIKVDVNDGKVRLSGTVGSYQEHGQAYVDAWVAGVQAVDTDQLEVEWWARENMRLTPANALRSDDATLEAVIDALRYDPRVDHENVEVLMKHGVATLSGHVGNMRAREAAAADTRNTLGVRWVVNNIKVRPEVPDDQTLQKRVAEQLEAQGLNAGEELEIKARRGWVTLMGEVETSYEKTSALLAASSVKGVIGVHDKIRYERVWTWRPDRELEQAVRGQLIWDVFIDSDAIEIEVNHGIVTLKGSVSSWSEYDDAEKNGYQAGAKQVINKLTVDRLDYPGAYGPYYHHPFYMGGYVAPQRNLD